MFHEVLKTASCSSGMVFEDFDALACAADFSDVMELKNPKGASRRVAKTMVEWDRLLQVKEVPGYECELTR